MNGRHLKSGFTLLELSIVLVIIGLLVGAILGGKWLLVTASMRAQVNQFEKFNSAAHAFDLKYGALPGDLPDPVASDSGFTSRGPGNLGLPFPGGLRGTGDGNGIIEGARDGGCTDHITPGVLEVTGETATFWNDLSKSGLIEGNYLATENAYTHPYTETFPLAKIGDGNYVYVWSQNGKNYYGLSIMTASACFSVFTKPGVNPAQAYFIDTKIDDGLPQKGVMTAMYLNGAADVNNPIWAGASDNAATNGDNTTCYDNNGVAGEQHYSTAQNGGKNRTCAFSIELR